MFGVIEGGGNPFERARATQVMAGKPLFGIHLFPNLLIVI
jgi:hypothetical protein